MITKEELAQILNKNQYGNECPNREDKLAKENNLVIVYGYSDDNMEFAGAINDEVSCYDGGHAFINKNGLGKSGKKITAVWDSEGYSWIYKTNIPHATFEIFEDEERYCRGIVFSLDDLK